MLRSGMGESPDGGGTEQSRINRTYMWLSVWAGRWRSPGGLQRDGVTGRWVAPYRKKENRADTKWA